MAGSGAGASLARTSFRTNTRMAAREQRARIVGELLQTEARFLARATNR